MWDEMWADPAALTHAKPQAISSQKNGRGGSKRQNPKPTGPFAACKVCTAGHLLPGVQVVTNMEYVLLYILCPLFAWGTELPSEALVKREANPNHTHRLQVGPHLSLSLQQPYTTVSPLTSA